MLSALRGGNLLGFLSQLAYNSGILSKFVSYNAGKCSKFYELWHPPPNLYGVYWNLSDCV